MPPNVWAAYIENVERHLAEVTMLQAQAATYGATAGMKEARSGRQTWWGYLNMLTRPKEVEAPQVKSSVYRARLARMGIAVKEVSK